ncbi:hypothetical protein BpHYR1_019054 [Brachionus plicatilis]|uniref:Uncharacterized protein n=1 Tax=Brachionus plicatilis TaxID=10195 RepID=A0A3M7P4L0_BRAPC|nr:hypothetical protein BpHYR1_019054 [Brachionus plicatilis]
MHSKNNDYKTQHLEVLSNVFVDQVGSLSENSNLYTSTLANILFPVEQAFHAKNFNNFSQKNTFLN